MVSPAPTQSPTVCPSITSLLSLPPNVLVHLAVGLSHRTQGLTEDILCITPSPETACSIHYRPGRLRSTHSQPPGLLLHPPQFEVEKSGNQFNKGADRQLVPGASQQGLQGAIPIGLMDCCSQRESSQLLQTGKELLPAAHTGRVRVGPKRKERRRGGECTVKCPAFPAGPLMSCVPLSRTLDLSGTSLSKDRFDQMRSQIPSCLNILESWGGAKPSGQRQTRRTSRKGPATVY